MFLQYGLMAAHDCTQHEPLGLRYTCDQCSGTKSGVRAFMGDTSTVVLGFNGNALGQKLLGPVLTRVWHVEHGNNAGSSMW